MKSSAIENQCSHRTVRVLRREHSFLIRNRNYDDVVVVEWAQIYEGAIHFSMHDQAFELK